MIRQGVGTAAILLVLLLAWQVLTWSVGSSGLASPAATGARLLSLLGEPEFWGHAGETARAFALSFVISLLGGVALGAVLGLRRVVGAVAEPILVNLYSLPKVTLYPLVLLTFGLGLSARVAFGVMHGLIPITLFTMNAIANLKPVYLRTAGVMRLTSLQTAGRVVLPAVLPEILAGCRLGFSLCLLGVLIGEMFASRRGLGAMVTSAMGIGDMATVLAIALLLAALAILANTALLALARRPGT